MISLLYTTVSVLFLLGQSSLTGAVTIPLVILHHNHEGSHAIAEALGKYPCVAFISECLNRKLYPDDASQEEAMKVYFNREGLDFEKLLDILPPSCYRRVFDTNTKKAELKICQERKHPILIPVLYRESISVVYPEMRLFPLIRSDLMRHALSASTEEEAALGMKHPHFNKTAVELVRHKFTISLLKATATDILSAQKSYVKTVRQLVKVGLPCSSIKFMFYEDFLDDQDGFIFRVIRASFGEHFDPAFHKPLSSVEDAVTVKRVHPADISTFVENSAEVLNFFLTEPFPTFAHILADSRIRCKRSELILASYD